MTSKKRISVQIVYRNYKPLHKIHESLIESPPTGVNYIVPKPIRYINKLTKIYKILGDVGIIKKIIQVFQQVFFANEKLSKSDDIDLIHYINIISKTAPPKPYVVEFEHPSALTNFNGDSSYLLDQAARFLENEMCKAVICMSEAAKESLKSIYKERYGIIEDKVEVIYPAIDVKRITTIAPDHKLIIKSDRTKFLFVGNGAYRKGLEEVLWAFRKYQSEVGGNSLELHIISNDARAVVAHYDVTNVRQYKSEYSKEDIIKYFFKTVDYFIMPTKADTFGMVFVDALAAGTPVISTTQYAVPEIVTDQVDGLLLPYRGLLDTVDLPTREQNQKTNTKNIDDNLAESIFELLNKIVGDDDLRKILSENTIKKFQDNGVLSIDNRNKKFLEVYQRALGQ